jgi:hypothetical protein
MRQSAFGLVGDLAQHSPDLLGPLLAHPSFFTLVESNADVMREDNSQSCANNAVWALGEIYLKFPTQLAGVAGRLNTLLIKILSYQEGTVTKGYLENAAVALGRGIKLSSTEPSVQQIGYILGRWATLIGMVVDPLERETSWIPMIHYLLEHPEIVTAEAVPPILKSISHCHRSSANLEASFAKLVQLIIHQIVGPVRWRSLRTTREYAALPTDFEARFGF